MSKASLNFLIGDNHGVNDDEGPRLRILRAALELFVERGYFNTNVPDISKLSRCSIGSIYHHFLNKGEIASQLFSECLKEFRSALCSVVDTDATLEQTIKNLVRAFLEFAEDHHHISQYLWLARHSEFLGHNVKRPTALGFDELGRKLTESIKKGIRNREIGPLRADVFWSISFGIPLNFMRDWLDGFTRESPREAAPVIGEAVWSGLKAAGEISSQRHKKM